MLRAIGIYKTTNDQPDKKPERIKYAQQDKSIALFAPDQLANFEKNSLPNLLHKLHTPASCSAIGEEFYSEGEYHYVTKTKQDDFFMVICSRNRLMPIEVGYLFINIRHAYTKSELMKYTLDDVILNPIGYTGQDKQIDKIARDAEETKHIIMTALSKAIENNHKLEELLEKTEGLQRDAVKFNRHAQRAARPCCF